MRRTHRRDPFPMGPALGLLLVVAGCAPAVTPGVADQRARAAEVAQQGHDVKIASYHEAARAGAVGTVEGRAYAERRKPDAADAPLDGTVLMLFPRSESFLSTLETIKRHARDSLDHYRDSAQDIRRVREAYETALLENGGGDLPRTSTVAADGSFTLSALPAGEWVLVAAHTAFAKKATPPAKSGKNATSTSERLLPAPQLKGHSYVTMWLRELTVPAGGSATVALTDRNVWLTGVVEDTETPVFRASPPLPVPTMPGGTGGTPTPGSPGSGPGSPTLSPTR